MSILSDFLALVDPIMDGKAYRGVVPDSAVAPYAKFFRVAGVEGVTLDENGGTDNETQTRIQIDIYALSGDEADTKAKAVKEALKTWKISNVVLLEFDGLEDTVTPNLHRATLDIATTHQ
jgi:hypothetical protein